MIERVSIDPIGVELLRLLPLVEDYFRPSYAAALRVIGLGEHADEVLANIEQTILLAADRYQA